MVDKVLDSDRSLMRALTYYVAASLDGFIADADGGFEAFTFEGDFAEHLCRHFADTLPAPAHEPLGVHPTGERFDTVVMGWNTYAVGLSAGLTSPYPHLRQVVATRRADPPAAADVEFTADPLSTVRRLKAAPGTGIWLAGGGTLAAALIDEIDAVILKVNPVVLGDGIPLFAGLPAQARKFETQDCRSFQCGVTLLTLSRRRP